MTNSDNDTILFVIYLPAMSHSVYCRYAEGVIQCLVFRATFVLDFIFESICSSLRLKHEENLVFTLYDYHHYHFDTFCGTPQ